MDDIKLEKVMNRQKIADSIHEILETGVSLLRKDKLQTSDFGKIKVLRTLGTHVNAAISMVQQETAQLRAQIVIERMRQLGYNETPKLS